MCIDIHYQILLSWTRIMYSEIHNSYQSSALIGLALRWRENVLYIFIFLTFVFLFYQQPFLYYVFLWFKKSILLMVNKVVICSRANYLAIWLAKLSLLLQMVGERTYINFNMAKFDKKLYTVGLMCLTMWGKNMLQPPEDMRKYSVFSWCFTNHYCHHEVGESTRYFI